MLPRTSGRLRLSSPAGAGRLPALLLLLLAASSSSYAGVSSPFEGPRAFTTFPAPQSASAMDPAAPGGAVLKTGTTIAGIVVEGAVILAADTRSTMGKVVADKNCEKIHKLSEAIYCCGAGTAADAEQLTGAVRQWLKMERAKNFMSLADQDRRPAPRVVAAASGLGRLLFRGGSGDKGGPSAAFVLGGVDATGPKLFQIESDGTIQPVRFTAMGSGFAAAMAILEARHRPNMTIQDGVALLHDAITSGILNDMGSGSHVDMCIIRTTREQQVEYLRDVRSPSHSSSPSPTKATTTAASVSFLHPRGALAAAAGPRATSRADIARLVGGRVGRGDVRHEPLRPYRRRELRFHLTSKQGDDREEEEEEPGALTAAAAALAVSREGMDEDAEKKEDLWGSLFSPSGLGFELRLSSSPDEDVEVL